VPSVRFATEKKKEATGKEEESRTLARVFRKKVNIIANNNRRGGSQTTSPRKLAGSPYMPRKGG